MGAVRMAPPRSGGRPLRLSAAPHGVADDSGRGNRSTRMDGIRLVSRGGTERGPLGVPPGGSLPNFAAGPGEAIPLDPPGLSFRQKARCSQFRTPPGPQVALVGVPSQFATSPRAPSAYKRYAFRCHWTTAIRPSFLSPGWSCGLTRRFARRLVPPAGPPASTRSVTPNHTSQP